MRYLALRKCRWCGILGLRANLKQVGVFGREEPYYSCKDLHACGMRYNALQ